MVEMKMKKCWKEIRRRAALQIQSTQIAKKTRVNYSIKDL